MNIVATALYNPLSPAGDPVALRTLSLPCNTIRVTIVRVRRKLSETEIRVYAIVSRTIQKTCSPWSEMSSMMPVTTSITSIKSAPAVVERSDAYLQIRGTGDRGRR